MFYYLLKKEDNKLNFATDVEEQALYGISPPIELWMNVKREQRFRNFWKDLKRGEDILLLRVVKHISEENVYQAYALSYAEKKHRYMEDIKILMYLKEGDIPPTVQINVGSYFTGVYYSSDFEKRQLFVSLKENDLERESDVALTVVEEEEFPLQYTLAKQRPYNSIEAYMGLSQKRIFNQLTNLFSAFSLDEYKFHHLNPNLENFDVPEEEKISTIRVLNVNIMSGHWFKLGRDYYGKKNLDKALECFATGFKYKPYDITALLNRVALYANINNYQKAKADLETCLRVDPDHQRSNEYMLKICDTIVSEFQVKNNHLGVVGGMLRILHLPDHRNNEEYQQKLFTGLAKYDFEDVFSVVLDSENKELPENDTVPTPGCDDDEEEDDDNDDEDSTSVRNMLQALQNPSTTLPTTVDPEVIPASDGEETVESRESGKKNRKKHKKKHTSRHKEYKRHRKESRHHRELSRSPPRRVRSRTPISPRRRRTRHSRSFSPVRMRRSRSRSPRRTHHSRSPSPHRLRRSHSRTPPPRGRRPRSPSPHYRRSSPRRRRTSSSS